MSKQPQRSANRLAYRALDGKVRKVTIGLRPDTADKLRLAAVALGLDQGDLVEAGLAEVLKRVKVRVEVSSPGEDQADAPEVQGPQLRAV